ncbi:glutamate--tRNA ligase family protein, partial [Marinobacter sp. 1Y8]
MPTQTLPSQPIGRFAPSPTGELHLGSLTTALASFCHIKSIGGKWLLRMEDTDTERCDRQFTEQILMDLEALGLHWDGDVIYQSERIDIYNDYLSSYLRPLTYGCQCSRKDLEQYWAQEEISRNHSLASLAALTDQTSLDEQISPIDQVHSNRQRYPRRCVATNLDRQQHKLRIQLPDYRIGFNDGIQGLQWDNPQQT